MPRSEKLEREKPGNRKNESTEPETPHDHVMSSDSDISNFEFRRLDDPGPRNRTACALRSVESNLEIAVPNRRVPSGAVKTEIHVAVPDFLEDKNASATCWDENSTSWLPD